MTKKNKKPMTIEDLAGIVSKGFHDMESLIDNLAMSTAKQFGNVSGKIDETREDFDFKLNGIHTRLDDINMNWAKKDELHKIDLRLLKVEQKPKNKVK